MLQNRQNKICSKIPEKISSIFHNIITFFKLIIKTFAESFGMFAALIIAGVILYCFGDENLLEVIQSFLTTYASLGYIVACFYIGSAVIYYCFLTKKEKCFCWYDNKKEQEISKLSKTQIKYLCDELNFMLDSSEHNIEMLKTISPAPVILLIIGAIANDKGTKFYSGEYVVYLATFSIVYGVIFFFLLRYRNKIKQNLHILQNPPQEINSNISE